LPHHSEDCFPQMPDNYCFDPKTDENRALHPQAWMATDIFSYEEIVRRRRTNYERLASMIKDIPGPKLLYPHLPEGVCPLSFPLVVSNRDACVLALQARGIAALPWWAGFHRNTIDWGQFPEASWLKQNVLTLPIHQALDDQHLEYLASTAAQVFRRMRQTITE
jgi:perosamine synthetase